MASGKASGRGSNTSKREVQMMAASEQCGSLIGWQEHQEGADAVYVYRCCNGQHMSWTARKLKQRTML